MKNNKPAVSHHQPNAFSLIELLVVVCIMTVLIGITAPAGISMQEGNDIARAGQIVSDQIRIARQLASARSLTVEVRLIKVAPSKGYNAVQLWDTCNNKALSKVITLPSNMTISDNVSISEAFKLLASQNNTITTSGQFQGCSYKTLQLGASGQVLPSADMNALYLTVVPNRFVDSGTLPNNYVMIQINPSTGNTLVFRP